MQLDIRIQKLEFSLFFFFNFFRLNICGDEDLVIISVFYDDWYDLKGFNNRRFIFNNMRNCTAETPAEIPASKHI